MITETPTNNRRKKNEKIKYSYKMSIVIVSKTPKALTTILVKIRVSGSPFAEHQAPLQYF